MKYKHEQLIKDYLADTSQIVQFQRPASDYWETWRQEWLPSFYENYEWRLLPAPKPDLVIEGCLGVFNMRELCMYVAGSPPPNIRATFDAVTGELKSVEKI